MKNYILVLCLFLLTLGCKKAAEFTQFDMDFNETIIIPSSTGVSIPFNLFTPNVETNSESTFEINDTRKDLIEEIKLTKLDLEISSPSNADFSFLNSISIFISADNLDEVEIAWLTNISSSSNTLSLSLTGIDLKEYIKKDEFSLRVNTETDEILTSDHHIDIKSTFFVDAEILGL